MDTSSLKSPEEKLRIVLAVLGGTVSLAEAARQEQVSATTIRRWRDQFMLQWLSRSATNHNTPIAQAITSACDPRYEAQRAVRPSVAPTSARCSAPLNSHACRPSIWSVTHSPTLDALPENHASTTPVVHLCRSPHRHHAHVGNGPYGRSIPHTVGRITRCVRWTWISPRETP